MEWTFLVTGINVVIAAFLWCPSWLRIWRRKSSADYSITTFVLIAWIQLSNMGIAASQARESQFMWFGFNAVIVLITLGFVVHYRERKDC